MLLDAHSMPGSVDADLVLGTLDAQSAGDRIADAAYEALRSDGGRRTLLCVRRDNPYRGGEIVRTFGRPADGVHALQLEVSRRLYMDERVYRVYPWPGDVAPLRSVHAPTPHDISPLAHQGTPAPLPSRRRGRELAELLCRVRSVVRTLAELRPQGTSPSAGSDNDPNTAAPAGV